MPARVAKEVWENVSEFNICRLDTGFSNIHLRVDAVYGNSWVIQTDAVCFDNGIFVLGCVIKDPNGEVFLAATQRMQSYAVPSTIEGLAIRWGL